MNSAIEILNHWGGTFLDFARAMFWQSSVLVLVLLALDFALRRRVRAAVRHGLWLVLLVKLVLPTDLALPTSPAWWWSRASAVPVIEAPVVARNYVVTQEDVLTPDISTPDWVEAAPARPALTPAAGSLLLAGVVSLGLLGWLLRRWWQVARASRAARPDAELALRLGEARALTRLRSPVPVKLTRDTMSPAVCGLFRPVILLPQALAESLSPEQMRVVLLHELVHVRRGDVWVNLAQSLLQIVYWWHPLVWLANARLRRVREEAVDEAVMVALRGEADIYAPTLLAVAKFALHRPVASLGLVGILESRSALRRRIERLVTLPVPRRAGLGVVGALGIVAFSAVALPMGEAPPLPPQPAPQVALPAAKPAPWPDTRYEGYRQVNLLAHFLIMDATALRSGVPTLANAPGPVVIPRDELDGLLTKLKQGGARYFNDYPGGVAQGGISGARFHYHIGGETNNPGTVAFVTTNAGGRILIAGLDAALPATQPDWTPMDLTLHPWLADEATRCEFKLTVGGQEQSALTTELMIPSEGALAWVIPVPAQPGKCQVILVMSWTPDIRGFPLGFRTRSYPVQAADLRSAWRARGWPEQADMSPYALLTGFIYDAGLNWLPPRTIYYNTNGWVEAFAPTGDLQVIGTLLAKINARSPAAANAVVTTDDRGRAGGFVQDGKVLYEMGKLDEAKTRLNEALALDPDNATAKYYLDLIKTTHITLSSSGRQALLHKLESIRLANADFEELPLNEVLRQLSAQAKVLDPEKQGVNFLINPHADSLTGVDPATGLPPTNQVDVGATMINVHLTDIRLADALDAIVLVADRPIQYSVQDFAVVFSPKSPAAEPLHIRTYKVSVDDLAQGMGMAGPVDPLAGKSRTEAVLERLRVYLNLRGVNLNPPKFLSYNHRLGVLAVKGTEADLDAVNKVLDSWTTPAALPSGPTNQEAAALTATNAPDVNQLMIDAMTLYESGHGDEARLKLVQVLRVDPANPAALYYWRLVHASALTTAGTNLFMRTFKVSPGMLKSALAFPGETNLVINALPADQLGLRLQNYFHLLGVNLFPPKSVFYNDRLGLLFVKATAADLDKIERAMGMINNTNAPPANIHWYSISNRPAPATMTGILSNPNFQVAIHALEQRSGVEKLAEPEVTTTSGRQSHMRGSVMELNQIDAPLLDVPIHNRLQLHIKAYFIEVTGDVTNPPALARPPGGPNEVAIVAGDLVRPWLHQLAMRPGTELLAEPEVTTTAGRHTQMRATTTMSVLTGVNPKALTPPGMPRAEVTNGPGFLVEQKVELGPIFDVAPRVMADGCTINMRISATGTEFAGYDQPTNEVRVYVADLPANGPPATTMVPAPRFDVREFRAAVNLYDGQALIFTRPIDPRTGLPFEKTGKNAKHLLVLMTINIVDSAGNRVHTDEELSFAHDHVPPASGQPGAPLDDRPFDTPPVHGGGSSP